MVTGVFKNPWCSCSLHIRPFPETKRALKDFVSHVENEIQVHVENRFPVTFCKLILQTVQQNLPFLLRLFF